MPRHGKRHRRKRELSSLSLIRMLRLRHSMKPGSPLRCETAGNSGQSRTQPRKSIPAWCHTTSFRSSSASKIISSRLLFRHSWKQGVSYLRRRQETAAPFGRSARTSACRVGTRADAWFRSAEHVSRRVSTLHVRSQRPWEHKSCRAFLWSVFVLAQHPKCDGEPTQHPCGDIRTWTFRPSPQGVCFFLRIMTVPSWLRAASVTFPAASRLNSRVTPGTSASWKVVPRFAFSL